MYNGNNVTDPILNYWDGLGGGTALWEGIRDCNIFMENIDKVRDLSDQEKRRWIAEVKFLKAYYHFFLFQLYGPIPIVRDNLPINSTPEDVRVYRESVDEVINYVVQLLDEATPELPLIVDNAISEMGRITKPIALAVKAKVLVTAASPLFNGNADYSTMVDNRGKQLFSQTVDPAKWQRALQACQAAIDTCHAAGHALYRFQNSALVISEETKKVLEVSQIFTDKWNVETIWGWASTDVNSISTFLEQQTIAPLDANHRVFSGAGTSWSPTMKMAEMFYSKNGVPIEEDVTYDYNNRYALTTVPLVGYSSYMQPGYVTANLHLNREARFYGNIGVDGGWWYGLGRLTETAQWPIQSRLGQLSGKQGIERFTPTSFYLKKYYNYQSVYNVTAYIAKRWSIPIFRLADLYLLYAESLNETLAAPNSEVYKYVDMIRERAGLSSVADSWTNYSAFPQKYLTKVGMRDIIHKERNIELAFEGQRFYDVRRWKEALQTFSQPVKGWNINGTDPKDFYQVVQLRSIQYNPRDILWPIKQSTMSVNTNLIQNPGW
jgi:hypothetical protein